MIRSKLLVCVCFLWTASSALAIDNKPAPAKRDADPIKQLIAQLGSDDFTKRREAEAELIELGTQAFDYLQDAQADPDLEIATQAQYLLHRVGIKWSRPDDSEEVQTIMNNYAAANDRERRNMISQLAALDDAEGLAALSRIAHFELSGSTARAAALAVLNNREQHQKSPDAAGETINREIGVSPRDSARWLRLYAEQLKKLDKVDPRWLELIDEEIQRVTEARTRRGLGLLLSLMEFHVQLCQDLSEPAPLFETLRRRIDLTSREENNRGAIAVAIKWCMKNKQWLALDLLEVHYAEEIKTNRLLLYLMAGARGANSKDAEATEFATRAYELIADDAESRNMVALEVADMGRHDWAEKEWRYVIDNFPIESAQGMFARSSLANWCLHDRGEDKEAAELLAEVCDAVEKDAELKMAARPLRTQREYFTACHLEGQEDYVGQRRHLEKAFQLNSQDPDVLIAMYKLKDVDDRYKEKVLGRINRAVASVEQIIESEPDEAEGYNHYAWLVSNTVGDYDKAVRYSLKSLELEPDTPSYLDTLGRCYFAAGDLENAVKYQRQAVEMHPQVQVMRRQLEQFEKALAEKK
jgi:tetratricopeptide (TPR) repeat protein